MYLLKSYSITDTQTDATENIITPHLRVVITTFCRALMLELEPAPQLTVVNGFPQVNVKMNYGNSI